MSDTENLGSFFKENGRLAREWVEAKAEIFKLTAIRFLARSAGFIIWTILSLFIGFLFIIFIGITIGFYLSSLLESYTAGFGIVTAGLIILLLLLAAFRKKLFIDPIIRAMLRHKEEEDAEPDEK